MWQQSVECINDPCCIGSSITPLYTTRYSVHMVLDVPGKCLVYGLELSNTGKSFKNRDCPVKSLDSAITLKYFINGRCGNHNFFHSETVFRCLLPPFCPLRICSCMRMDEIS